MIDITINPSHGLYNVGNPKRLEHPLTEGDRTSLRAWSNRRIEITSDGNFHFNNAQFDQYVQKIKDLMDPRLKTLYQGAHPYIMDKISSIDVDTKTDFIFAETILSSGSHQ